MNAILSDSSYGLKKRQRYYNICYMFSMFYFILIHEHHVKAILRAGGDIFGQLARTQNVVIGLLVSKIYPTKTLEIYSIEPRKKEIFAEKFILLENRG